MEPIGRRERKKQETRASLQEAALRLFGRKGFDETTVEDICEAVDVSTRTFNRYFARKEDVLFAGHDDELAAFRRALDRHRTEGKLLDPIRAAILATLAERAPQRELDLIWARLVVENPNLRAQHLARHEEFAEVITAYVAKRLRVDPEQDPRPELAGACCIAIVDTALRRVLRDPGVDLEALIDLLFDTLTGDFDLRPAPVA